MRFVTIIALFYPFFSLSQNETRLDEIIDSLEAVANSTQHDTTRINALVAWDQYIYIEDPELDFQINQKIAEICDRNLRNQNLSPSELKYYYKRKCSSSNVLGLLLVDKGDYIRAQDYLLESKSIAESLGDTSLLAGPVNNLGLMYKTIGLHEKSLEFYLLAMDLDGDSDWSRSIYLNNIAIAYVEMDKIKLAKNYYEQSIQLSEETGNYQNQANAIGNLGEIYFRTMDYDSALYYFLGSLDVNREIGNIIGEYFILNRIGMAYLRLKDPDKALEYCLQSYDISKVKSSLLQERDCHRCLYLSYQALGQKSKAFDHIEIFKTLDDSLLNDVKMEEIMGVQYQMEYEKQLLEDSLAISTQQKIKEVQLNADLKTKNIIQYVLYVGIFALILVAIVLYRNFRLKQKDNEIIAEQKRIVENQKFLVEEKNQEITDSITYAKRLQEAILPTREKIKALLPDSFVLYIPKDIVAGDFYWLEETEEKVLFAIADCTGHGVPGALVSVVCNNSLNRAVREFKLIHPSEILDKTRELVIETFKSSNTTVKDGMDIALCCFDLKTRELEYAGANNSLYLLRSGELIEFKADKEPIGTFTNPTPFTNHIIATQENDQIFLFTDGFADQFGGEKGKKYKYKPFKEFLINSSHNSAVKQKASLENEFSRWLGDYEQIDDVCVMGVKFIKP